MKRICPIGSVFIKGHFKTVNGRKHYWESYCRKMGKSKKHILNTDEIHEIYKKFKNEEYTLPKPYSFKVGKKGNSYDDLIGFWVFYWNSVFKIKSNINVGLVKTLMMSESTFGRKAKAKTHNRPGNAIGLLQITDYTLKLIQPNSKELSNHRFKLSREDLFDPVINVAVSVRWLYRKRQIAKHFLKKEPSAVELAEEYKGIRGDRSLNANKQRNAFKKLWKDYREAK